MTRGRHDEHILCDVLECCQLQAGAGRTNATMGIQASKETCSYAVPAVLLVGDVFTCSGIPEATCEAKVDDIYDGRGWRGGLAHDKISRLYVAVYE